MTSSLPATPARRRGVVIALAAIALLVILGGWMLRRSGGQSPELVRAGMASLLAADTYQVASELTLHLPSRLRGRERPLTEITTTIDGVVVRQTDGARELAGQFTATATGQGTTFVAEGDVRALNEGTLFYLREFPVLLNPSGRLGEAWTRVPAPLLVVRNGGEVQQALAAVLEQLAFVGREKTAAGRLAHFTGTLSAESEAALAAALQQSASGSPALDVVARLLAANNVKALDVWVDPNTKQLARIEADFVRPLSNGSEFDFARLSLAFSDYGVPASIDRPEARLSVQPEVFRRLFGGGAVEEIRVEESDE